MSLYTIYAMFELINGKTIKELSAIERTFKQLLDDNKPIEAAIYIEEIFNKLN